MTENDFFEKKVEEGLNKFLTETPEDQLTARAMESEIGVTELEAIVEDMKQMAVRANNLADRIDKFNENYGETISFIMPAGYMEENAKAMRAFGLIMDDGKRTIDLSALEDFDRAIRKVAELSNEGLEEIALDLPDHMG